MSVIESKRDLSRMQYVKIAQDLIKFTTQQCLKLPKRLTFFISTDLVKTAQEIYKAVLHIRSYYSREGVSQKRLDLCDLVLARLDYLASMLDILHIYAPIQEPDKVNKNKKMIMTPKTFERWVALIDEETLLIKGLIKKEKERLKVENTT